MGSTGEEGAGGADLEALCSVPRHLSTTRPCSPGEKTRQPTPRTHLVSSGPSIRRCTLLPFPPSFLCLSSSPSFSRTRFYNMVHLRYLSSSFSLPPSLPHTFPSPLVTVSRGDIGIPLERRLTKILHLPFAATRWRCLSATAVN